MGDPMPRQSCWTAERIALLKDLWAQGATAAVIGAQIGGMSRSAVLGKVHRLRLLAHDSRRRASKPVPDIATMVTAPARRRRRTKYKQRAQPVVERQHKTIFELTNRTCRWPHGRPGGCFFFCGAPEADLERGIPYCAAHMRRAYPTYSEGKPPTRAAARLLAHWR
jgi:GcrA cell cycle regulator